jgi:SAM-dependent methyltransferase
VSALGAESVRGSRLAARTYDFMLAPGERGGLTGRRRALVGQARGAVLEIGAGTGLNLPHYPDTLDRLVLCEPDPHMAARLRRRVERLGRSTKVVQARAEQLPFAADTFDTVVSTLVLCTVADPEAALDEIRRVLRPDGGLLFLEHVRSDDPRLARWQDRLHGLWGATAGGCQCNRRTLERLGDRGYTLTVTDRAAWRRMPPLIRPLVAGRASPNGA